MAERSAGPDRTGPLDGTVVVDLSRALAGPHATMVLADLGARVVKVEGPGGGDETRSWGPPFVGPADAPESTYFMAANRNKESIQLDLKQAADLDVLKDLLRRADVLVENFRPGVLDRLGLPVAELRRLNPALVLLSITGFGHDGPEGGRAGYDQIAQGEAGLMSLTGPSADRPTRVGLPIGDVLAGLNGAIGVLAALAERSRTGEGAVVRTSLLAGLVGAHAFQGTRWTVAHEVPQPSGNHHPQIAPYGTFRCADGTLQLAVGNEAIWARFAPVVGIDPREPRFADNASRFAHRDDLVELVEKAFADRSRDRCLAELADAGVPAGAIRTLDEVYDWEQTRSQGLVVEVDHPVVGTVELPGPALRLEGLDGSPRGRSHHTAPPTLDQHADGVRAWITGTARPTGRTVA
ncbi:CaiB/BaiF CoA transferase family protein [Pseudonocardia broussonetiae]|uniref:CoA transferase n=1 Tax=Pseudonocardia broussonetiae TaxID=2736640 RepID=A0A6M6JNY5_9PSEU|nr:CoA transferase [Pseudonocardia broussonetiae]QJY48011.1 CoA transferase [Pseudonocardia broussonetiae]